MTTIIARQYDDRVEFVADSQTTLSSGRIMRHPRMSKISERNGFVIAGAGDIAPCDIAQHIWSPPKPTTVDKKDLYHFVVAKVVPSLKKVLKDNDYKLDSSSDDDSGFELLVAICGEVFQVNDDGSVLIDESGIYTLGSGSSATLGALKHGASLDEAMAHALDGDAYSSSTHLSPLTYVTQFKQ